MQTVVVRGSGGALFEMDVPTRGQAAELWAEKLAKGELVIVDAPTRWVEDPDGTRRLVMVDTPEADAAEPAKRRGRPPKATEADVPAVEDAQTEEG